MIRATALLVAGLTTTLAGAGHAAPTEPTGPAGASPDAPGARPPSAPDAAGLIARGDAIYDRRDTKQTAWEAIYYYREALKVDPKSYPALWRLARSYADLPEVTNAGPKTRGRLGSLGLIYAKQATRLRPDRVEGWLHAATCLGQYALSLGVIAAVRQGIEGKFRRWLNNAMARDRSYCFAAPLYIYGRFYYELPWPLRDLGKSMAHLREARRRAPTKIRTVLYLAETMLKLDRKADAIKELRTCVAMDPAREDPPDGRRAKRLCRKLLRQLTR